MDKITTRKINVPIELFNELTNTTKNLTMYGGFSGISYNEELNAYKPQVSMVLYHHDESYNV